MIEHGCHWRRPVVPSMVDHDAIMIRGSSWVKPSHSARTPGNMSIFSQDSKNKQQLRAARRCTEVVHKGKRNERLCGSRSVSVDAHGFCKDHRKKYGLNKGAFSAKRIAARRRQARCQRLQRQQYRRIRAQDLPVAQALSCGCQQEEAVSVHQAPEALPTWPSTRTSQPPGRGPEQQADALFFHLRALNA